MNVIFIAVKGADRTLVQWRNDSPQMGRPKKAIEKRARDRQR